LSAHLNFSQLSLYCFVIITYRPVTALIVSVYQILQIFSESVSITYSNVVNDIIGIRMTNLYILS